MDLGLTKTLFKNCEEFFRVDGTNNIAFLQIYNHFRVYIVMSKNAKIETKARIRGEFSESKLAELLGGLTKEEYKKFGLFIRSPYFNKSKTLEKLYEYFKPRLEKLDDPKITKEN